jgi:maltose alpha-D-glucosyltransferase/alpha-amylase
MQWTPDRNGGFSSCEPGRLYLPLIMDSLYGYQAVNVETQINSSTSLLHWNRHMIEVRKRHPAFGLGDFHELRGSNPAVLIYVRSWRQDTVLCANNMSRFPQPVELDMSAWNGWTPYELTGGVPFPPIGELPYFLTLPGHGFYWFVLQPPDADSNRS